MPNEPHQRTINIWQPLAFATVLVVGLLFGMRLQQEVPTLISNNSVSVKTPNTDKIEEVLRFIEARYVDEVDQEEILEKVINGIFEELDPHSSYIPADQLQDLNDKLDGNFEGIGIEYLVIEDTITVMTAIKGGPSDKAGILIGDKIVAIEDSLVVKDKLDEQGVVKILRGKKGSAVKVGIKRSGEKDIIHFQVTRDEIPINSVDVSYMLTEKTGYIKVNRFSSTTNTEFLERLERLQNEDQMENLVIDVRDNPGGYLQEATSILNQFFKEKDKLLVYTEGRTVRRSDYETTGRSFFNINNIAVLIDEGSASASEILAGAIQDWDRGVVIGRRSFGKGLVQEQYDMKDGDAMRLTIARYYTPSGRSIQKNYTDKGVYDQDIANRFESGELYDLSLAEPTDTVPYYTNDGRTVYGGGGIAPDIFVPLDSARMSAYFTIVQPYIRSFIFKEFQKNKGQFNYQSIKDFTENYSISPTLFEAFQTYTKNKNPKINTDQSEGINQLTKLYLKARLAKHLYEDEGLYTVLNSEDKVVKKAIQIMDMPNPLSVIED